MKAVVFINIPREEVEARDTSAFIRRMAPFVANPMPAHAGAFLFVIDGYHETPDETYAIPAVREYWQDLDAKWPYTIFFANTDPELGNFITNILFCFFNKIDITTHDGLGTRVDFSPAELFDYLRNRGSAFSSLYSRAYGDRPMQECEEAFTRHLQSIVTAFQLPFTPESAIA